MIVSFADVAIDAHTHIVARVCTHAHSYAHTTQPRARTQLYKSGMINQAIDRCSFSACTCVHFSTRIAGLPTFRKTLEGDLVGPTEIILLHTKSPKRAFTVLSMLLYVASLRVPAPRPLLFTTLAGLLGWRCLLSVRNTRCSVRACELVEMHLSHGQCVRIGSPAYSALHSL